MLVINLIPIAKSDWSIHSTMSFVRPGTGVTGISLYPWHTEATIAGAIPVMQDTAEESRSCSREDGKLLVSESDSFNPANVQSSIRIESHLPGPSITRKFERRR